MVPVILMWCLGFVDEQCTKQGQLPLPTAEQCFQAKEIVIDEAVTDGFANNHVKCVTIVEVTPKENKNVK